MSRSKNHVQEQALNADVNFVSRWSKLKHETRQNSEAILDDETTGDENAENKTSIPNGVSDEEQQAAIKILTDKDMPDIESMTADSDYTDFFSSGVSEELRKLALRKLFLSEVFNIRDGLDEYDGDYTQFEALGDIVTADMKHQLEMEAKRKAEELLQHEKDLNDENSPDDELLHDGRVEGESDENDAVEVDSGEGDNGNQADEFKNNNKNTIEKSTKKLDENAENIDVQISKMDKDIS